MTSLLCAVYTRLLDKKSKGIPFLWLTQLPVAVTQTRAHSLSWFCFILNKFVSLEEKKHKTHWFFCLGVNWRQPFDPPFVCSWGVLCCCCCSVAEPTLAALVQRRRENGAFALTAVFYLLGRTQHRPLVGVRSLLLLLIHTRKRCWCWHTRSSREADPCSTTMSEAGASKSWICWMLTVPIGFVSPRFFWPFSFHFDFHFLFFFFFIPFYFLSCT